MSLEMLDGCCSGQRWCAVTCTASLIARKWHAAILEGVIRDGPLGFRDLQRTLDGVSNKVLHQSLVDLQRKGLVRRRVLGTMPRRTDYAATDAGRALGPVIEGLGRWGRAYLAPAQRPSQPHASAGVTGSRRAASPAWPR